MKCLIDIPQLSVGEIKELMDVACDIDARPEAYRERMRHKKLATLFYEPSTRTRLSFEAAMIELGGSVIGFSSPDSSSASKGESIADTSRVISCYADVIVMRHPTDGAATVAALNASVPVINAGDGGHCHPTQTLADLLTIYREKGRLHDLTVGFCGDLKYGRTVHSLINALARYENIKLKLISPQELRLPAYMRRKSETGGAKWEETESLEDALPSLDILYMTRIQQERFADHDEYMRLKDSYVLNAKKLSSAKPDTCVLHPLPRVNEIDTDVDGDKRACYFKQVRNGKLMRMALILRLTEGNDVPLPEGFADPALVCPNPRCVCASERAVKQKFIFSNGEKRCFYCDHKAVARESL